MAKIQMIWFMILSAFLFVLTSGCSPTVPAQLPDLGIPEKEMNREIRLEAPTYWNTFKSDDVVSLSIDNMSGHQISFPADFGARIFMLEEDQWVEIPNLMKYPDGYILLPPSKGDPLKMGNANIVPGIPEPNKPVKVRIILIGNVDQAGQPSGEKTAAFIDLELRP